MVIEYVAMAKYDSLRKLERNRMLLEYADAHPDNSQKEIGQLFNITESRVSRILKKERARKKRLEVLPA
jgi:DNA-directed RNA polymerase specialized sigma subunit